MTDEKETAEQGMPDLWVGFGVDHIAERVSVLTIADTKAEALESAKLGVAGTDQPFTVVCLTPAGQFAATLFTWLRSQGIVSSEAKQLIQVFAKDLHQQLTGESDV